MKLSKQKISTYTCLAFLLASSNLIMAQNSNDLEGWSAVQIDIEATKKMSFSISEHLRYRNDITTVSTYFTQIETGYEIAKNFEIGVGFGLLKKMMMLGKNKE